MQFDLELKKLGFSSKEAKIYVSLLESGQAAASEIASRSGVNRATTYVILEELKTKGLVSTFEKEKARGRSGKKTYFVAEPPERLRMMLEREAEQLKSGLASLSGLLPDLMRLYEARGERPKVRFFEGKEGIAAIREDVFTTKTDYFYEITNLDAVHRFLLSEKEEKNQRVEKLQHIEAKTIYSAKKDRIPSRMGKWERMCIPDLDFSGEIALYAHKTVMIGYKQDIFGIIIEDSVITQTIKLIFELLWNQYATKG